MTLGQRVAVMRDGLIQQVDSPQHLYRNPANLFVAAFIGSPSMNLVEAELDDGHVLFAGHRIPLDPGHTPAGATGSRVILGIRPHDFEEVSFARAGRPTIEVEAAIVEQLGSETHVLFAVDAPPVDVAAVRAATDEPERSTLLASERHATFTAVVDESVAPQIGQKVVLAIDPSRFHFFDPVSAQLLSNGGA